MKCFKIYFAVLISLLFMGISHAQNCDVNAGGSQVICGTTHALQGSTSDLSSGTTKWTLVSKPDGATDPIVSDPMALNPQVTGLNYPGIYTFRITKTCKNGVVTSEVKITAPGDASSFTAGPDITDVSALTGIAKLKGVIPKGYTASWNYYQIYNFENFGRKITDNATMVDNQTATPTFTLNEKENHPIDPAYRAVLRITSINNPNCFYEDDAIVRFIPNPKIKFKAKYDFCKSIDNPIFYLSTIPGSPIFATSTNNSSGNPSFGTVVTMNVISEPFGGEVSISKIRERELYLNEPKVTGVYKFTLTISNENGIYTTDEIVFNYQGTRPSYINFLDENHPEQMMIYSSSGSGAEVFCSDMIGQKTPITYYFTVESESYETKVSYDPSLNPPGGLPGNIVLNGANQKSRSVTVSSPIDGWREGTYRFNVVSKDGLCGTNQLYYIHISDGKRKDVEVANKTVCYPGSGIVEAIISLPEVYKETVNSSYLKDFSGYYDIKIISKPEGANNPIIESADFRNLSRISTVIGNLSKEGEYRFSIKVKPWASSTGAILDKEYACSNAKMESEFSIFVSAQQGANAGSDRVISCASTIGVNGNIPDGNNTGEWEVISSPIGTSPVFVDKSLYNTKVNGISKEGDYIFSWTIKTGDCIDVETVTIKQNECKPRLIITNPMMPSNLK